MMKIISVLLSFLLFTQPVLAQGVGQLGSGQLWGNSTAARAPAGPTTVTGIIDRAISSTQGAVLTRQGSAWVGLAPGTAGLPLVSAGAAANVAYAILGLSGGGSGANLTASVGGLVYSGASAMAILAGTATAGQIPRSGASAAPSWSTATYPATIGVSQVLYGSAANVIAGLATANGGILNTGATGVPAITPTPVLGVAGTTVGSAGFQNATSGTVTIQPVTGALGTTTLLLPSTSGTIVAGVTSPITMNATSGVIACATCVTSSGGGAITGTSPISVSAGGVVSINTNGISDTLIRQGVARSVIGVAGNATANVADIQGTTDQVLRVTSAGTGLGFGAINIASSSAVSGVLALANGGLNANLTASNGGIFYSTATAGAVLSGTATASLPLLSGSTAAPTWATVSHPTSANSGGVAYFSSSTVMASSAALTANQIMLGGGAGAAPTTFACATATTVVHGGTPPTCSQIVAGDVTTNTLTNANLAQAAAYTFKGNATGSTANVSDFTVASLTHKTVPTSADLMIIADAAASNATKYATIAEIIAAVTSGVTSIAGNTGAFTLANGIDNSTNQIQLTAARRTLPTSQLFSSGTAATYTTSANALWIEIHAVGGGGGGGGGSGSAPFNGGGGGGSGAYCYHRIGSPAATYTYTVGAGGTAGTSTNTGGTGAATTFSGGSLSCAGGLGGTGGQATAPTGIGGGGQLATGGTFVATGSAGGSGQGDGTNGGIGGQGAGSFWQGGGLANRNGSGTAGTKGGGGGGGANSTSGGAGGDGYIMVIEHYGS